MGAMRGKRNTPYILDIYLITTSFRLGVKLGHKVYQSGPHMNLRFKNLEFAMTDPTLFWTRVGLKSQYQPHLTSVHKYTEARPSFCCCCCLFRAAPAAYGDSQASGQIGAAAAGLHHSHSMWGPSCIYNPTQQLSATLDPLTHWARLGIKPTSSLILVGPAEPQRELLQKRFLFMDGHWLPDTHNKGSINICLMNKWQYYGTKLKMWCLSNKTR